MLVRNCLFPDRNKASRNIGKIGKGHFVCCNALAIIVLGSEFEFSAVKGCLKELVITVGTRLVLAPLIMVTAAVKLGFTGEALACILVVFAAPVAVSSISMAQQMDGDEQLAAQLVVISSALSLLTLFVWIFSLGYFNLF
ncbi:MAG: AEC family transporter [Clostridia bacterium]|nr:AEC family transporter [Clostridia bacterium]